MATQAPDPYYVAFIDEAGDTGLKAVRPIDPVGATEWLCLGAVLIRAKHESEVTDWVRTILSKAGCSRGDLHYRHLSASQKRIALGEIAQLPLRGFVLASNKKNMRRHSNERAERRGAQQWFYNYCLRLLLERVTDFCFRHAAKDREKGRFLKLAYSERSVHSYAQTAAYHELLKVQAKAGALVLQKRRIMWEVLDWRLAQPVSHLASPGAQLADLVTSAFYQAVNTLPPTKWNIEFARLVEPIMAKENGSCMDYGVALQPTPTWKAKLNDQQKQIFEFYGYKFWP
ncbi:MULTISPECIES: DUF3800 domain-containing protein [unclassified Bradyrhizobium]|uniref:DUF3800 domain-containing protein n=1 Tax=unclassified Bradyrhizobium TaxID=2631580 RepID=UPI001BAE37F5|nr:MULTISPECIES: DUF3800 domain-containing protein [unclassified Bradyrhizobium]MBR1201977.1 DUF3800 domain-containing protein [Bradyrhizobium sp. AUGA SZCCT0124]MBR1311454.1 DUF3800 domain-containing protein [Bradyrhizobium sp. AUGA SZCCT0051]MBR1338926.1 DUF3800 domain-containing protein [Bradyrhizobium sp. AUGA SZCCT0105]MBR1353500.1 DUF3800 domain-containing protein [Bradyrhizobium sp. AUGA SZCCT0045]